MGRLGEQARTWVTANTASLAGQALGGAGVAVELLTGLALAVFCSVFFLASGERIWAWVSVQLGARRRRWDAAARAGWATFAGYTRGVVVIAASNAVLVGVALLLLRVPLALPLALLVFFAAFVPLVGAPIALAVATLVALAARGPLVAILVVVLTVAIGQVEGHILHPLVMSRAVNLHPLAVALSVASGTVLAGVIGAVVAVPLVPWPGRSGRPCGPDPRCAPVRRPVRRPVRPRAPSPEDEPTRFLAVRCPGADGEDLMESQRIAGRYLVLRAIGRGGMGVVWLCRDEVLGREVAVKQIGGLPGEPEVETARAMREARSAAALNHPNVVVGVRRRRPRRPPVAGHGVRRRADPRRDPAPTRAACPRSGWPASGPGSPMRWPARTSAASCTATSSPATCSSTGAGAPRSATSASPAATATTS